MNKLIIFSCLVVAISSLCTTLNATKWTDCKNKTLGEEERIGDSCCFVLYQENNKNTTYQYCSPFKKADVAEIVKQGKKSYNSFSIDCSSNWISYSLFLIVFIFMS